MMEKSETGRPALRRRIGTLAAVAALGIGGAGFAGCGDDDNEGPLEEAGKAIDEGASDTGDAVEDAANSDEAEDAGNAVDEAADDAGSEIDEAADDTGDAVEEGADEATTDDDK